MGKFRGGNKHLIREKTVSNGSGSTRSHVMMDWGGKGKKKAVPKRRLQVIFSSSAKLFFHGVIGGGKDQHRKNKGGGEGGLREQKKGKMAGKTTFEMRSEEWETILW